MSQKNYYFHDENNPTCYHLAKALMAAGFFAQGERNQVCFGDENLALNEEACQLLEYKHLLVQLLQQERCHFLPESYVIDDYNWTIVLENLRHRQSYDEASWILKPSLLNNGEHIHLFANVEEIYQHYVSNQRLGGPHILQLYLDKPDTLAGCKYTLRFYVVITNYAGVYLYPQGYSNCSAEPYQGGALANRAMHLTNEHLAGVMQSVTQWPTFDYPHYAGLLPKLKKVIRKTIKAADRYDKKLRSPSVIPAFSIFGFDFLVDQQLKPWLLEVNHGPHFPTDKPHVLQENLLVDFWQAIANDFLLPIATGQEKHHQVTNSWLKLRNRQSICQRWVDGFI